MPSKIEWTDETWSPVTGCSKLSPGCLNCYAERMDRRQMMSGRKDGFRSWTTPNAAYNVRLHPERLQQPLKWKAPRRIFVCSMGDLFHERVPFPFIAAVFGVMAYSPHTYQVPTKRPARALRFFEWLGAARDQNGGTALPCNPLYGCVMQAAKHLPAEWSIKVANEFPSPKWPLPNVHLLFSAEDQKTFDERWAWLLKTPAAVRGVSLEPLLGPIILDDGPRGGGHTALTTEIDHPEDTKLDWVIVGGESGPGARPMNPDWVRAIRDQCQTAGVPFFFKQWGEYGPTATGNAPYRIVSLRAGQHGFDSKQRPRMFESFGSAVMRRVGKKAAGRNLDGRTWDEFPS